MNTDTTTPKMPPEDVWKAAMVKIAQEYVDTRRKAFIVEMDMWKEIYEKGSGNEPVLSPLAQMQAEVMGALAMLMLDVHTMVRTATQQGATTELIVLLRNLEALEAALKAVKTVRLP
jgi:hypothetical protein